MECKKFERGVLVEQQSCSRMCRDEIETVQELGKSGNSNPCPKAWKSGGLRTPTAFPLRVHPPRAWGALSLSLWQVTGARTP